MAIRLDKAILRGEITNEVRGRVTGRLWLANREEPVELNLRGNCLRDLAGCRLRFENPNPRPDPAAAKLASVQEGATGDLTASRKTRIPTVSEEELLDLLDNRQPIPGRVVNCLYLEWFSESSGRVVIESTDFRLNVDLPRWHMTAEAEREQIRENQSNFHSYLDSITGESMLEDDEEEEEDEDFDDDDESDDFDNEIGSDVDGTEHRSLIEALEEQDVEEEPPLDEFEWEQELREADRRAEAYQEAFDRYRDHPDRERLIAEAMKWEPEEVEEFRGDWDVAHSLRPHDPEELIETAGHFTRDEEGAHHPLSRRAMDFALRLQRDAKAHGLLNPDSPRDNPAMNVIVSVIALGCKLAAALDGTMHGLDPEPGFVIAMLKRAQVPLNEALHALSSIQMSSLPKETRHSFLQARAELFELRKDILDLMRDLRRK